MVVTGAIYLKIYHLTRQFFGTTNNGEQMEKLRKLEIFYIVKFANRSKKSSMDNLDNY